MAALQRLVSERRLSAGLTPPVRASLYNALTYFDDADREAPPEDPGPAG
jgi:hypothetical protein